MHTRIRPPCAMQENLLLCQALQHIDHFPLNRRFIRLHLPAVEIRAVVGNGELEMTHLGRQDFRITEPCARSGCPASLQLLLACKAESLPVSTYASAFAGT